MTVRVSEEVPSEPPSDPRERERLQWMMQREAYRIARQYENMTRTARLIVVGIVGVLSVLGGILAIWDSLWGKIAAHFHN